METNSIFKNSLKPRSKIYISMGFDYLYPAFSCLNIYSESVSLCWSKLSRRITSFAFKWWHNPTFASNCFPPFPHCCKRAHLPNEVSIKCIRKDHKNGIRDACSTADIIDCLLVCFYRSLSVLWLYLLLSVSVCFISFYLILSVSIWFYLFYLFFSVFFSGFYLFSLFYLFSEGISSMNTALRCK